MAVASSFVTGGSFNCDYLSSTSCSSSSSPSVDHQVRFFGSRRRIKPLVYWTRSHSLSPKCELSSNSVVKNGKKESRTSSLSALELLKTSAADRYASFFFSL
uniref:Putative ovule protein n=1 Tax=Solanum chacoense TaxID=4108 RepID=A0A0V0H1E3_SOLCH